MNAGPDIVRIVIGALLSGSALVQYVRLYRKHNKHNLTILVFVLLAVTMGVLLIRSGAMGSKYIFDF